jgi:hypothetical protein
MKKNCALYEEEDITPGHGSTSVAKATVSGLSAFAKKPR